jgi:CheY-like chemotaxis protein
MAVKKLIPAVPIRNTDCFGETALPLRAGIYRAAADGTEMETHHKILILDDDADWLDLCRELLAPLASKPEIRTVSSGARALALLESEPFRLLVCDLKMPRMDGLQVLAIVRRRFPQLRTVVLSGLEDEEFRSRAYALGVDLFWLKADMQQNTQMFLDCLESLLGREVDGGFRGIQSKSLMDIIQMECLSRSSAVLRITRGPLVAKIWIQDGELIDAETEGTRGETAVRRILAWKSGTFESLPAESGRERTITKPINALLLESAQTIDESANVSEPESMEQDVHRKTVWKLGLLMREGAEFVVSVPPDGQGAPEALGTQSTAQLADWTRLVAEVIKHLGERIEAGPLSHVAAIGVDRQLLIFPSERKSFLVGWPPGDAAGEILEKSKRLVVSWDS